jgi:hypothetical protein
MKPLATKRGLEVLKEIHKSDKTTKRQTPQIIIQKVIPRSYPSKISKIQTTNLILLKRLITNLMKMELTPIKMAKI